MKASSRLSFQQLKRPVVVFGILLFGQFVVGVLIIYIVAAVQMRGELTQVVQRAKEDIVYSDGQWDTSRYDTDPEIPGPNKLYVVTKDGFIIDRSHPISGYLDTSDFKQLQTYISPKTVSTVTGQMWRLYSTILNNGSGDPVGIATIGVISPDESQLGKVDGDLMSLGGKLAGEISTNDSTIDTSKVNVRGIPYNVSFQVVDQFNKIHLKSDNSNSLDRLPNYIDPSYIVGNLKSPFFRQVADDKQNDLYLVHSEPVTDKDGKPVGTVIAARTIEVYRGLLRVFVIVGLPLILALTLLYGFAFRRWIGANVGREVPNSPPLKLDEINSLAFNKATSAIEVNGRKIKLTQGTNQYNMCQVLMASPKKRWTADELLAKIGEKIDRDGWRKLYDAMNSVNKKVAYVMEAKLITTSNKTYRLNIDLVSKITK
jgi:hypothetical protein